MVPTSMRRQHGMIVPLVVLALGALMLAVIAGVGLINAKAASNAYKSDQNAYLHEVQRKVAAWYAANVAIESNPSVAYASDELLAVVGIQRRFGIVLVLSPQLNDGTVAYHKVAIV